MAATTAERTALSGDLIEQLTAQAMILEVFEEGQDIALDLHEALFNPASRARAIAFLQSTRYQEAAALSRQLNPERAAR